MNMNMSMAWHVLNKFHEHEHKHGMAFKGEAAAQQVLQCSSNGAQEEKIKSRIPTAAAMDRDECNSPWTVSQASNPEEKKKTKNP